MALSLPNPDFGLLMIRLAGRRIPDRRGQKRRMKKKIEKRGSMSPLCLIYDLPTLPSLLTYSHGQLRVILSHEAVII